MVDIDGSLAALDCHSLLGLVTQQLEVSQLNVVDVIAELLTTIDIEMTTRLGTRLVTKQTYVVSRIMLIYRTLFTI